MRLNVIDTDRCVGCQVCMFACSRVHGQPGLGRERISVRSAGGMERGFVVVVCRACSEPPCAAVCPNDAAVLEGFPAHRIFGVIEAALG